MVELANTWARDWATDGVPASGIHEPQKPKIRQWGTWLESSIQAGSLGDNWKATKTLLDADLTAAAGEIAVVYNDSTAANNGTYVKVGASGTGSWSQITDFLPGYQFVRASVTGGTFNAIEASASPSVSYSDGVQQIAFIAPGTTTASPATVQFDGGPVLRIRTSSGADIPVGGIVQYMPLQGYVNTGGTELWITNDLATAAHVAAAQAAQAAAEAAAASVAGYGPYFTTVALMLADSSMSVSEGDTVTASGHRYQVAASGASDHHLTTAGGVKLYVLPGDQGYDVTAFGALGDGVLDANDILTSGTDNIAAFENLVSVMASSGRCGYVPGGIYRLSRQLDNDSGQVIIGESVESAVLYVSLLEDEVGVRITVTGSGLDELDIIAAPSEPKLANNGQYHACVMVGENYFTTTAQAEITSFRLGRINCRRANNGISSGYGVFVIGNITGGSIGHLTDQGSKKQHSGLIQLHWAGQNTNGGYGFETDEVYPILGVSIDKLNATASGIVLTTSSVGDFTVGEVRGKGAAQLWICLAGDETNRYTRAAVADRQMRAIRIGDIIGLDMADTTLDAVSITSLGTSTWEQYPSDAITFKDQIESDIEIDTISITGSTNTTKPAFDAFEYHGSLKVGKLITKEFAGSRSFKIIQCTGLIEIGYVETESRFDVTRSKTVKVGGTDITISDVTTTSSVGFYSFGDTDSTTLGANAALGATTIVLASALTFDVLKGSRILVNGNAVQATAFCESGVLNIPVTPLPAAVTSGQTVVLDNYCRIDANLTVEGGYYAIDLNGTLGKVTGPGARRAGYRGMRARGSSNIDLIAPEFRGNGVNRVGTPALSTGDIEVEENSFVRQHGGTLGNDGGFTRYNVYCASSDPDDDNRYFAIGVQFVGNVDGRITASSVTDYEFVACTDGDGNVVTS